MNLEQRINAFVELGKFISQFSSNTSQKNEDLRHNELFYEGFKHQLKLAKEHNGWFTESNITFALSSWSKLLTINNLESWTEGYTFNTNKSKTIALIMAGNVPLVGFHDFLSVLISGHSVLVKQSSNDKQLLPYLAKYLEFVEPGFKGKIEFTENKLTNFDAVIATGSDNTARYFDYYFRNKPSIIRKNRNSVAVLTGTETEEELKSLSNDIFRYFGLGCRNVSKIFVPQDYDFDKFFRGLYEWHPIFNDAKYANNYDYNKAVYLMSEFQILENGFLMIKEDLSYGSPIATVFYEYYQDLIQLKDKLQIDSEKIQCVVSKDFMPDEIKFGATQIPELSEYADNVDTIEFLLNIS